MSGLRSDAQRAAVDQLLATAAVTAIGGVAVYARHQAFDDTYPRTTIDPAQRVRRDAGCGERSTLFLTVHAWARGPDASLVAADLADAHAAALGEDAPLLVIPGHRVEGQYFESSSSVGDPDPAIEHIVTTFRVLTTSAA